MTKFYLWKVITCDSEVKDMLVITKNRNIFEAADAVTKNVKEENILSIEFLNIVHGWELPFITDALISYSKKTGIDLEWLIEKMVDENN